MVNFVITCLSHRIADQIADQTFWVLYGVMVAETNILVGRGVNELCNIHVAHPISRSEKNNMAYLLVP